MRPTRSTLSCLALACTLGAQDVRWEPFLTDALARAEKEQKVLFVALGMPGERDSEAVQPHYRDRAIAALTEGSVNCYVEIALTDRPLDDERLVLERFFDKKPRGPILLPHHLIIDPDGRTVLSSVAGRTTAGELEWFVADGLAKHDPESSWQRADRCRAPLRLRYEAREEPGENYRPRPKPTKPEVDEAISALNKSRFARNAMTHYGTVLRSDERSALDYIEVQMRGGGWIRRMVLRSIGRLSPPAWTGILVENLAERDAQTRESAARGLEQLGDPKALRAVRKQLRSEKEEGPRGWLARAAARLGPTDKAVISTLARMLDKDRSAAVRMHVALAAGVLEIEDEAIELLTAALGDTDHKVRAAAAYSLALRRDLTHVPLLEKAAADETDETARRWIQLALEIIRQKRDMSALADFAEDVRGSGADDEEAAPERGGGRGGRGGR